MQVIIGLIALLGFVVMLYPEIVDHFTNTKDFRDECRTMV